MKFLRLLLSSWLALALPLQAIASPDADHCRHHRAAATQAAPHGAPAHHADDPHAAHAQAASSGHCQCGVGCAMTHCLAGASPLLATAGSSRAATPARHLLAHAPPTASTRAAHALPLLRPPSRTLA